MRRKDVRPYLGEKWPKNRRIVPAKLSNTLSHILNMRKFLEPVRKITNFLVGSYLLCYYLFKILNEGLQTHVDDQSKFFRHNVVEWFGT